jgi:hypothetical protein
MTTYPQNRKDFLIWADAHVDLWVAVAAQIGLTPAQATNFRTKITEFRERTVSQEQARLNYSAETEGANVSYNTARTLTSDLVRAIRSFAVNTNNPAVYQIAQIPAPADPGVVPPPGQPTDFRIGLNTDGSITIRFKAVHPKGSNNVIYFVQRKLAGETVFTLIGGTGERRYTDTTLPVGVDGATYIITGQRGGVQGEPSSQLAVTFGSGGDGAVRGMSGSVSFTESSGTGAGEMSAVSPFMTAGKKNKKKAA